MQHASTATKQANLDVDEAGRLVLAAVEACAGVGMVEHCQRLTARLGAGLVHHISATPEQALFSMALLLISNVDRTSAACMQVQWQEMQHHATHGPREWQDACACTVSA